jgi:hypothetical protein
VFENTYTLANTDGFLRVADAFHQLSGLHIGVLDREIQASPPRKPGRLPPGYFVCERNSVGQIRTQVGMRLRPGRVLPMMTAILNAFIVLILLSELENRCVDTPLRNEPSQFWP